MQSRAASQRPAGLRRGPGLQPGPFRFIKVSEVRPCLTPPAAVTGVVASLLLLFLPHDPSSNGLICCKTGPQIEFCGLLRVPMRLLSHARVSEIVTPMLAQQAEGVY